MRLVGSYYPTGFVPNLTYRIDLRVLIATRIMGSTGAPCVSTAQQAVTAGSECRCCTEVGHSYTGKHDPPQCLAVLKLIN